MTESRPGALTGGSAWAIGATGPLGRHLAAALEEDGMAVRVLSRTTEPRLDVRERAMVTAALETGPVPDLIFYLAGCRAGTRATVAATNVMGLVNVVEGVLDQGLSPRLVVVGSSAQYGLRTTRRLIRETDAQRPHGWYGATKCAQELAALTAATVDRMEVVVARVFNLIGPGQEPGLLPADILRQLHFDGVSGQVTVGPLLGTRDFVDYRDAARALTVLGRRGRSGEAYNVCSGTATPLEEILSGFLSLTPGPVAVSRIGTPGERRLVHQCGDPGKLVALGGWRPTIRLRTSLADMVTAATSREGLN